MNTDELLQRARAIWGDKRMTLDEIIVVIGVVYGDICRQARSQDEGGHIDNEELQKELGNLIFSVLRWADDLGYDPNKCIQLAIEAQQRYVS